MTDSRPLAIFGDWHGDVGFAIDAIRSAALANVRTMVHVGDLGLDWPGAFRGRFEARLTKHLTARGITLLASPGNHDNWRTILQLPVEADGLATWRPNIRILPRGGRTRIAGLTVGGLGGAFSVDFAHRTEGKSWWADEEPTTEEAQQLVAGGPVDILITHDAPNGVPMRGDFHLSREIEERAGRTRLLLREVIDALEPANVFCGHWHQRTIHAIDHPSGRTTRVDVLADENSRAGNAVLVWPDDPLRIEPLIIRGAQSPVPVVWSFSRAAILRSSGCWPGRRTEQGTPARGPGPAIWKRRGQASCASWTDVWRRTTHGGICPAPSALNPARLLPRSELH